MPENRAPQVAYLEEYDDDQNKVKPGTVKEATQRRASSVRPPQRREAASDSGYSSYNSAANTNARDAADAANTSAARQHSRSKPVVIQRSNNQRAQQSSISRAETPSQDAERRYTLPNQYAPEQQAAWNAYHAAQAQHQLPPAQANVAQYAQQIPAQAISGTSARHPSILTRARPASIHGYIPNVAAPHGPPPSPAAYQNYLTPYHQNSQPHPHAHPQVYQQSVLYDSTPSMQMIPSYLPPSTVTQSMPKQLGPSARSYNQYSTRQANPTVPRLGWSTDKVQIGPCRRPSLRHAQRPQMPGSRDSSGTDSETDSEGSEMEQERQRRARKAKRDRVLMPPPNRRPSVHRNSVTVPEVPRTSRERLHRSPRSDVGAYDLSSSDNHSSDRTARAVVSRPRTDSSHSSRSRRPSVSTEGSRGTKQTSLSSGSGYQRLIVEDHRGRRAIYVSRDEGDQLLRQMRQTKLNEEQHTAEEYQRGVSGRQVPELTAENIRQATQNAQRPASGSHTSARSRKSGGSSKTTRTDGIEIKAGGTVLHLYGDAKIEMQAADDGGLARLVIGGSSRDSAYYGSSKGSGSRLSARKPNIPQDGYESAH